MPINAIQAPIIISPSPTDHIQESMIILIRASGSGGSKNRPSITANTTIPPQINMRRPTVRINSQDMVHPIVRGTCSLPVETFPCKECFAHARVCDHAGGCRGFFHQQLEFLGLGTARVASA
jgi:hypothetical protein